jgi:hypothetical protein
MVVPREAGREQALHGAGEAGGGWATTHPRSEDAKRRQARSRMVQIVHACTAYVKLAALRRRVSRARHGVSVEGLARTRPVPEDGDRLSVRHARFHACSNQ